MKLVYDHFFHTIFQRFYSRYAKGRIDEWKRSYEVECVQVYGLAARIYLVDDESCDSYDGSCDRYEDYVNENYRRLEHSRSDNFFNYQSPICTKQC